MREVGGDGGRASDGVGVNAIGFDHFAFAFSDGPAVELVAVFQSVGQGDDIAIVVRSFLGDACSTCGFVGDGNGDVEGGNQRKISDDGNGFGDGECVFSIRAEHLFFTLI